MEIKTWKFKEDAQKEDRPAEGEVKFSWGGWGNNSYQVRWGYDINDNVYRREHGGAQAIDSQTGAQVWAKNLVVQFSKVTLANDAKHHILYETIGEGDPKTIQAADALAGGTALSTEGTCGALVGGLLAIGSVVGRTYEDFSAGKRRRRVFQYAKKLYDKFTEEYGSPLCKGVQKKIMGKSYNLLDAKEYAEFEKAGGHVDKCTNVSGNTARWAAEIIMKIRR